MKKLFVVGLERCGTHTVVEAVKAAAPAGKTAWHEEPPYLCREAYCRFHRQPIDNSELAAKIEQHMQSPNVVCEANHRFGMFVHDLATAFPKSKFLLLVRDPVDTLVSRFANASFVPDLLPLIDPALAARLEAEFPHDYNRFRLRPPHKSPLQPHEYLLYELIKGTAVTVRHLRGIDHNRVWVTSVDDMPSQMAKILNWFDHETPWNFEAAYKMATKKHDSVYAKSDRDDLIIAGRQLFSPHRDCIATEFLSAITGYGPPAAALPMTLSNPRAAMKIPPLPQVWR